jgi:hypothetical protein
VSAITAPAATATEPPRGAIFFIFITLLFDMLSFGVLITILPKLVEEVVFGQTDDLQLAAGEWCWPASASGR